MTQSQEQWLKVMDGKEGKHEQMFTKCTNCDSVATDIEFGCGQCCPGCQGCGAHGLSGKYSAGCYKVSMERVEQLNNNYGVEDK